MKLIETEAAAREFQNKFIECCITTARTVEDHTVTFRPRSVTEPTYFYDDFWIMPTDGKQQKKSQNRYWNCFGLGGDAATAEHSIAIEINYPHIPDQSWTYGKFLTSGSELFLGHNGVLGGGRKAGGARAFLDGGYTERFEKIRLGKRDLFVVAKLIPDGEFVNSVRKFVLAMSEARANGGFHV